MNQKSPAKLLYVVWAVILSLLATGAFFVLMQAGNTVLAQRPGENVHFELEPSMPELAPDRAEPVKAILVSAPGLLTERLSFFNASAESVYVGRFTGNDAHINALLSAPIPGNADTVVSMDSDRVWGFAGAGETVTVTVDGVQMGAAMADNNGFYWTTLYNPSGFKPDLDGGETVAVYHEGSLHASTTLRVTTVSIDVIEDDVDGNVDGLASSPVTVYPGWAEPNMTTYSETATTDLSGNFGIDFTGDWDFIADDRAQVVYTENGIEVHQRAYAKRLIVLGWPNNRVVGNADPGAAITVTVYEADGVSPRMQAFGNAADDESGAYEIEELDMEVNDIVEVEIEGNGTLTRTVDPLELYLDADNDRITGVTKPFAEIACRTSPLLENGTASLSVGTIADASGMYTVELAGISDIMPGYWNGCYVHDAEGDDMTKWEPAYGIVVVDQTWDAVYGRAMAPSGPDAIGRMVTLTIDTQTGGGIESFSKGMGWAGQFDFNVDEDGLPDIVPGDTITVESEGFSWQGVVNVNDISVQFDVEEDQFTGEVNTPSDRVELSGLYWDFLSSDYFYPVGGGFQTLVTATSSFTAESVGFDVRNGIDFFVEHRTPDDLMNSISAKTANVRMWAQYNSLSGVSFPPAGTSYTVTLYDSGGTPKAEFTGDSEGPVGDVGWLDFNEHGVQMTPGDYLELYSAAGLSQTLHIPDAMEVTFDADADVISGAGPANTLLIMDVTDQGKGYVPTDGNGDFIINVSQLQEIFGDGDLVEGQDVMLCYLVLEGNQICTIANWPGIWIDVNYAHQWFEIRTVPNETVYVTVTDSGGSVKGTLSSDSDGEGNFRSYEWEELWDPEHPGIYPGDYITATVAGMEGAVSPIGEIYGEIDLENDLVTGTLNAPWFSPMTLTVSCEVWVEEGPGYEIEGVAADGGTFVCDFVNGPDVPWDLQAEHEVALRYREPDDDSVINVFRAPWMRVNYGHDWIGGSYPAGHTLWITQTQSGIPMAYAVVDSELGGGWSGDGFETRVEHWTPSQPNLEAGDVIIFTSDDGYTNTITVGDISGNLDIAADYISGTVNAPWFESTLLHLICEYWHEPHPRFDLEVPSINGDYECDFSGEADLQIGYGVAVMYVEPDDGDYVINVFEEPAPDVEVQKWTEGEAAAGGRLAYWIEYWNHGEVPAENVTISDTLPVSTTYIVDTSGFPVSTNGNQVIWDLGTLEPQTNGSFRMVIDIDPLASGQLVNEIEIATSDETNPDNNYSQHELDLQPTDVDLSVDKWIHHANPAPGYNFKYMIQFNNEGSTGSGQVTLTDTLPVPTSYIDFYSQDALWYLESYDGVQVVLVHPGLPGHSGNQIELTLHMSDTINVDDQFTNTVEIMTTNETGTVNNNYAEHISNVNWPYMNIGLNKDFAYGTTVAGYDVTFGIYYRNHDNVPAHNVSITDTLPAGTSFVTSTREVWNGNNWLAEPLPPDELTSDSVVWHIGTLESATEGQIFVTLAIDPSVTEGSILTNTALIGSAGPNDYDEDYFEDNEDIASVTVREAGSNLMIVKRDRSNWEGDPPLTIRYDFQVYNVGSVPVSHLQVVDTYPNVTTFNYAELWWGGDIQFQNNDGLHQATWTITETLWPGESFGGQVTVDLEPSENRGSIFTNTIEIAPVSGDIYPQDNVDYEVLTTGPDLYVEKTVDSEWVEPGDLVTFTLHFGNKARRGEDWTNGSTTLTDTLPSGMTYVTSTLLGCEGEGCPYIVPDIQGNQLIFETGPLGDGWWNEIYLTVMVDSEAKAGDTFGNYAEIQSATPVDDPEGDYSNNIDTSTVTLYNPAFSVTKDYETSMVAGTQVTYTLTVTNSGNEGATGVLLSDSLPTGLSYGSGDGTYSTGIVTWDLGTIAALGGTASGWFNAILPCTLDTITNDDYAVSASDQGVVSDPGPEETFAVVAPAIGAGVQQSALHVEPDAKVYFTGTMSTDGAVISGYTWFFHDLPGQAFHGQYVDRTFTSEGIYTATFAITDTCGYVAGAQTTVTVESGDSYIFLPIVMRN